jgi:hypothetical protein
VTALLARTSATGKPLCTFTLSTTSIGARATVITSMDSASSPSQFASARRSTVGTTSVTGVGDAAFYVGATSTLQFLDGKSAVVVQAQFAVKAGTKYAARIKANLITLGQSITKQI